MTTHVSGLADRAELGRWIRHGVIGGVLAGIVFAMFEMLMAVVQMGTEALFMPLRMIGGIALGQQALDPATSLLVAGGAGLVMHMMMSALFGLTIAAVAAVVPQLRERTVPLVLWASLAGFGLWIINFYVIAPLAGWSWFPQETDPVVQFVAHTFVFGSLTGIYLDRFARNGSS